MHRWLLITRFMVLSEGRTMPGVLKIASALLVGTSNPVVSQPQCFSMVSQFTVWEESRHWSQVCLSSQKTNEKTAN